MQLFDYLDRHSSRPFLQSEPAFSFLNQAAEPYVARIRDLLEEWFDSWPEENKRQLRGRFRSKRNHEHWAAFFELYCHALLRELGFNMLVEPSPDLNKSTRPDFLVQQNGKPLFYMECRLDGDANEITTSQARLNQVIDAVNKLDSPDFFLKVDIKKIGPQAPRISQLRSFLRENLTQVEYAEVSATFIDSGFTDIPFWTWYRDGWELVFRPIPKYDARNKAGLRTVGIQVHDVRMIDSLSSIRRTLQSKRAERYGELAHPYVIGLNVLDVFADETDIYDVLFGHSPFFTAQNEQVSAVLVAMQLTPGSIASKTPTLWHNPFARRKLSPNIWQCPQIVLDGKTSEYRMIEGISGHEIFSLQSTWPDRNSQ